ncbi:hypothetical protein [Flavobacterium sp. IMCC34518]|uniref:hypothetical protein n=1 Tax=Flavobacterium sp. IMCC34518 TaxID=3003623 RepID=UPI0022AC3822|nr:hypothetical protein [Flavobacterium sp. IMCC34518]
MKKATLTIGLFTLVLSLTSFANPTTATASNLENTVITDVDGTGTQDTGGNKKVDFFGNVSKIEASKTLVSIDGTGTQSTGGNKKVD